MNWTRMMGVAPAVAGLWLSGCVTTDYSTEMQKAFERTFSHEFKRYQYFGMPVSGYGVGTMYPKAAKNTEFDPTISGLFGDPATWWTAGLTESQKVTKNKELFGDAETGAISVQLDKSAQFDIDVVMPQLYKLLSASAKTDFKSSLKVTLSADTAFNHRINWAIFAQDLNDGSIQPYVKQHYDADDYVITTADVVLNNYQASLVAVKSLDADAQAKLTAAWKSFSQGANASFTFSDSNTGNFTVKAVKPVVIATYIGVPPAAQTRSAAEPLVSPISLPESVRQRIINDSLYSRPAPTY